jgi:hypothetical protein
VTLLWEMSDVHFNWAGRWCKQDILIKHSMTEGFEKEGYLLLISNPSILLS